MPAAVVAVAASAFGNFIAGELLLAGIIEGAFAVSAVQFGAALAVSAVGQKVLGGSNASTPSQPRRETIRSPAANRRIIYGEVRVGGVLVYAGSGGSDNKFANLVVPVAHHAVHAIGPTAWLGDKDAADSVFSGLVDFHYHLGAPDQAADADLIAAMPDEWTAAHTLSGIAYVYVSLSYHANAFPTGLPSPSWLVQGREVYDPRTDTTAYSNNPALCILDYLRSDFGCNYPDELIDFDSFSAAANACDEEVEVLAGGTIPRYRINGVLDLGAGKQAIINQMLGACAGAMPFSQGKYRLYAGVYQEPTFALTEDWLAGPIKVRPAPSRSDLFNTARGTYTEPLQDWQQADFQPQVDPALLADDDGVEIVQDLSFPFTTDGATAQRLAMLSLRRSRGMTIEVPCNWKALKTRVWETGTVTLPIMGLEEAVFQITTWTLGAQGGINLVLREERSENYNWTTADETAVTAAPNPTFNTSSVPPVADLVPTLVPIDLSGEGAGPFVLRLGATWTAVDYAFLTGYEVQYKLALDSTYTGGITVTSPTFDVTVGADVAYDVRVRALGQSGTYGAWANASYTPPPPDGGGGGGE